MVSVPACVREAPALSDRLADDERAEASEPLRALLLNDLMEAEALPLQERLHVSLSDEGRIEVLRHLRFDGSLAEWLDVWGVLVGIDEPRRQLRSPERCRDGYECYEQVSTDGLPIFNSYVEGRIDGEGHLSQVAARVGREAVGLRVEVEADEARRVLTAAGATPVATSDRGYLVHRGQLVPVWRTSVTVRQLPAEVFVSATSGEILEERSLGAGLDSREVFYADPGDPPEGLDTSWSAWTRVYDSEPIPYSYPFTWPGTSVAMFENVRDTRAFLWSRYGRDGWDNDPTADLHRMRAASDVTQYWFFGAVYPMPARQAFFLAPSALANPNAASALFGTNANCLDAVAHEFFHGVEFDELGEPTNREQRALREGLSDAFGRSVEAQYGSVPDWVVGTGGTCSGYRSLSSPECPSCTSGGSCSSCDAGAAHYSNFERFDSFGNGSSDSYLYGNATVIGKAFHLLGREASVGAEMFAGRSVTGVGATDASLHLYDTVTGYLTPSDGYFGYSAAWQDAAYSRWGFGTNYYRAVAAIHAVGLWTGSVYEAGVQTNNRTSLAPFTVSGQARTYIAYRQSGTTPNLQIRSRVGTVWSTSVWSATTTLGTTSSGPALLAYGGELWLFSRSGSTNDILVRRMSSTGSWGTSATLPGLPQTDSDLTAVEFGGTLFVFYRAAGAGSQLIRYCRRTGGAWTGPFSTGAYSDDAPAAAVVGDRLYVVYRQGTAGNNLYFRYQNLPVTSGFGAQTVIPRQSATFDGPAPAAGPPTAVGYRGRLHVASASTDGLTRYSSYCYCASFPCACTYRANDWTQTVRLPQQPAVGGPVLYSDAGDAAFGSPLYLFYPASVGYWWDYKISE